MTATLIDGQRTWRMTRDDRDGHRRYMITHLVRADILDGPQVVMNTPGLPLVGSIWDFDNDLDAWAFCTPGMTATPLVKNEPNKDWKVDQVFSTEPRIRCQDEQIEDPLLEPQRISGGFVKYSQEIVKDKDGNLIKTSSHELFRGAAIEFDHNRPTVEISQNVSLLELDVFSEMVDTVNDATLWGLGPRKIKLSNVSWQRLLFGLCDFYFIRTFEFDIDFGTFDRDLLDEGTKVLRGHAQTCGTGTGSGTGSEANVWLLDGNPDPTNPLDFVRYKDCHGENLRTLLDGTGKPLTASGSPVFVSVKYYPESDFTLLGIPPIIGQ